MKKLSLLFLSLLLSYQVGLSQENTKFTVKVSMDSILFGNYFQVVFSLENAKGEDFQAPPFEEFNVISGPNFSSSFSMINGDVTQSVSYTFYLEPKEIGNYYIEPASIKVEEGTLATDPIEIMVVPNPEGIKQTPPTQNRMNDLWQGFGDSHMPSLRDFQLDFSDPLFTPSPRDPNKSETPKKEETTKKKKRKIYKI
ncbi:MAG: BatD family protein [Saprospiraceae bacterium]